MKKVRTRRLRRKAKNESIPGYPGVPKYYVAHPRQTQPNSWGKHTLEAAVEHGRSMVRSGAKRVFVVEVVAVIEPVETPVKIKRV